DDLAGCAGAGFEVVVALADAPGAQPGEQDVALGCGQNVGVDGFERDQNRRLGLDAVVVAADVGEREAGAVLAPVVVHAQVPPADGSAAEQREHEAADADLCQHAEVAQFEPLCTHLTNSCQKPAIPVTTRAGAAWTRPSASPDSCDRQRLPH